MFLATLVFLASLALLATLVNISYFFNYEDLHPCSFSLGNKGMESPILELRAVIEGKLRNRGRGGGQVRVDLVAQFQQKTVSSI